MEEYHEKKHLAPTCERLDTYFKCLARKGPPPSTSFFACLLGPKIISGKNGILVSLSTTPLSPGNSSALGPAFV